MNLPQAIFFKCPQLETVLVPLAVVDHEINPGIITGAFCSSQNLNCILAPLIGNP
jgi:hypothetical protein